MKKYLIIITALSAIALWPFFLRGYFESHDGEWMVIRFSAFHQAFIAGQFPVRYVERLNNNYGYPVLNFLYPLPFYLAEIPKILGFGFIDSIKIVFVLSSVVSSLAMFWALSQVFAPTASLAGSILYLYVPYRFVDLYVRGSLGENLAFAIIPLIFGSLFKIANGHRRFLPVLSIFISLLILSHNVMAFLFLPFFWAMSLIFVKKAKAQIWQFFLLGISISTFFWLPAIYDLQFVQLSQIKVSEIGHHLVDLSKLFIPSWGYGPNPNDLQGLSVQVGLVSIFIFLAAVVVTFKTKIKNKSIFYLLVISLLILFANTKYSGFLWQNIPFVDVIQFPWRMHSILIFITAFLAAYVTESADRKNLLASLVIAAAITSTILYTKPVKFVDRQDNYYSTNEDTTNSRDEYLPLWVKEKPDKRAQIKLKLLGPGSIQEQDIKHLNYRAQISSNESTTLQVATIYFPDFTAKVDGQKVKVNYQNEQGLMQVQLPRGNHEVIINYTRSPVHAASELISLVSILTTGIVWYLLWRKQSS